MRLYTQFFISIFIIFPYFIFTTEFYKEFNILLTKFFNKEIGQSVFKIIFSSYFIIYFICLIFGFCEFIIFDIFSGLITICSSIIFYKPFTSERNTNLDYFPHLEVIYVFLLGIYFIVHGIIVIIRKIKNRNYFGQLNVNNINIIEGGLLENLDIPKSNFKFNNISFEITKTSLKDIFFYFLTHKLYKSTKKKSYVTNFTKNDFNIDFDENSLIISINTITIKYKNEFINLKKFRGQVIFKEKGIKIKIIEKGKISHEASFFKNVALKSIYNLFKGIAVDKIESKINKKIKKGLNFKQDIFDINILIQEFSIMNDILDINFNALVEINNS